MMHQILYNKNLKQKIQINNKMDSKMDRMYAPWRFEYVTEEKIQGCVFCHIYENSKDDEKLGVLV